jgi:hypothetical protein
MKCVSVLVLAANCVAAGELTGLVPDLTQKIPNRPSTALTGSEFAKRISSLDAHQRERAILNEVLEGNIPAFLRNLVPVELKSDLPNAKPLSATIFVAPEYLAIGSNTDFLRIPMNLETANAAVARLGFMLPTRKMVDAIYKQSSFHFVPEPLPAGPQMRSTMYYQRHNEMIERQAQDRGIPEGPLVSGHKKDVVLTNLLATRPDRIAIYGWHRPTGVPIQPLSTVHGACYADYSHGIRLVSDTALIDGKLRPITELLQDPQLARIFSDEGPIHTVFDRAPRNPDDLQCGRPVIPGSSSPVAP